MVGKTQATHPAPPALTETVTPAASRKIIIIGGGIAGLSCGCYLQMNGLQTEILEAGALPGGLCTAWHRGPYIFDGCLRWLMGTRPPSAFHQIWQELGAIAGRKILTHDEILRVEDADGNTVAVPADLDELSREFKRIAPEDTALIDQLVRAARRCAPLEPPLDKPVELMTMIEKMRTGLRYLPMVPVILKWKNLPITTYLARYQNRFLRETLTAIASNERMSALVLVMVETTDLIFAMDSIPAIFAVTTNPFIIFTSNVFAILGLRSLYFVLAGALDYFRYLKTGLSLVLVFIGVKMLLDPHDNPPRWFQMEIPISVSLLVVGAIILISIALSIITGRRNQRSAEQ